MYASDSKLPSNRQQKSESWSKNVREMYERYAKLWGKNESWAKKEKSEGKACAWMPFQEVELGHIAQTKDVAHCINQ